jgi:DNA-binding MarR family transcriptional regulator
LQTATETPPVSGAPSRANFGFELAKASQRWNELLAAGFAERGYGEVRPAYGSVLLPLFEEDGLRMGQIATRSRLSKQTITTLVRRVAAAGLVRRREDPADGRAARIELTRRAREFGPVAGRVVDELEAEVAAELTASELAALRRALRKITELRRGADDEPE